MIRTLLYVVLVSVSATPGAVSRAQAPEPTTRNANAPTPIPPELFDGLHERWERAVRAMHIPGMAVAVVIDDKVALLDTFGIRNPETKEPVTPDTGFYIASCTKSFMAMGIATLVDEGKVDLDAPVKKYLPQFQIADPALTKTLTVRDLLSHAKGLSSWPITFGEAYTGQMTEERYYRLLADEKPRGKFSYSNVHFTLAGRIAQAVTGMHWKDFLAARIYEPAGMKRSTAYASKLYGDPNVAIPTDERDGVWVPCSTRKTDSTMHAAGGMGTTARDAARWLRLNMGGGTIDGTRVLSGRLTGEMQTMQADSRARTTGNATREGYGLGWFMGNYDGHKHLEHGGGYTGTAAYIGFLPERGIGVAVLANSDLAAGLVIRVAQDVFDRFLGIEGEDTMPRLIEAAGERRRNSPATVNRSGRNLAAAKGLVAPPEAYAGTYVNDKWGTLEVRYEDGKLLARAGALSMTLIDQSRGRFFVPELQLRGRFTVDADSRVESILLQMPEKARFMKQ